MPTEIVRYRDPSAFSAAAEPFLVEREAQNNLLLGILDAIRADPSGLTSANAFLGIGFNASRITGVGIWMVGYRVVLSYPDNVGFGAALGEGVRGSGVAVPGVLGPDGAARAFAALWRGPQDAVLDGMAQLIYGLSAVADLPLAIGRLRAAEPRDRETLTDWWVAFVHETDHGPTPREAAERTIDNRLATSPPMLFVWDHDGPVSMASARGPTPHGIRVGGVYTPPEVRRRGYATACVATLSRQLLAGGRLFCFLFTDARNPTSNAIYRRIGYELVAEVTELVFNESPAR